MSPTPEQIEAAAAAIWNYGGPFLSWGDVCGKSFADETREKARVVLEAAASVPPPAEEPIGWCVVSAVDRRWADHESSARALAERLNADPYNRHPYTVCAIVPQGDEP